MDKKRVLFICVHNSARSQMAEAFLKQKAGDSFEVESAGINPGKLNPLVVEAMAEVGIDISQNKTKDVFDFYKLGKSYDYAITVCSQAQAEGCPVFPGKSEEINWSFDDPSTFLGSDKEKLEKIRVVRDRIEEKINQWLDTI